MQEERIIRDEANYFANRHLSFTTDLRAIERFRRLKDRLQDFYAAEYKAIFLDQIEVKIKEDFTNYQVQKQTSRQELIQLRESYFEQLLFYVKQELDTLPLVARQQHTSRSTNTRNKVFVSYSLSDKAYLEEIKKHFKPFEKQLDFWDNSKILPGQNWQEEIQQAISQTKVIILLLSADFLASDFILSKELPPLLQAAEKDGAVILSLIVRPCLFEVVEALNQYQTMNPHNKPVLKMDTVEREELYVNLVRQTQRILAERR